LTAQLVRDVDDLAGRLHLARRYAHLDEHPRFPWEEFRSLGAHGLLGLTVGAKFGGREFPLPVAGAALHRLAYRGGTAFAKLALQPEFSSVLAEQGSATLRETYFAPMLAGKLLVGNHITEPGAGSDAASLRTTARRRGALYVLNGTKTQAAFAVDAHAAIVYARSPGAPDSPGLTAILVPQDLPGIHRSTTPDLGEKWMRRGTVTYADVEVPEDYRLGEEGRAFDYLKDELTRERALLAAIYLGVAQASWEETVAYVGEREAFGRSLARNQAVSFPLVEDGANLEAAGLFVQSVLGELQAGRGSAGRAAVAKWMATDAALRTLDHAIQFHGGRGYSREFPHEQRWRDVRSGAIAHGSSEIMHHIAARELWPKRTDSAAG
ncbi:MAG: acyl-CoA/acyl-ACP dehydrogenase, partial [Thermoplasmata archaeon]|nr:acyl-CoA/acyl-ACP dehydrogenase [Thermoplasmata archaeon]